MENSVHVLLGGWESYYVIVGGGAAVLTGLQFVVIALVAERPALGSADTVAAFGTPTVLHFCLSLFIAALLSAPWTSLTPVIWLLLGAGMVGLVYTIIVFRRARRQTTYRPVGEDWLWHVTLPLIAYGALTGAAIGLPRYPATALYLVGAVALALLLIGIHNAWDAVAYLAVPHRPKAPPQ